MNIAFYFSGKGTRVRKILDTVSKNELKGLRLLICDNSIDLELFPKVNNFSFHVIDYNSLSEIKKYRNLLLSDRILNLLTEYQIDYLYCWGDHILKGRLLEIYKNKIINFHPSILPMFPGRLSIDKANNDQTFLLGNSAHFVDEGIDSGPIIMQSVCHNFIFNETLNYDTILDHQISMFRQINLWLISNRLKVINNKVFILDSNYKKVSFFPSLEF